jgi:hypothetical protein
MIIKKNIKSYSYTANNNVTSNSNIAFFILSTSNIRRTRSCTDLASFEVDEEMSIFPISSSS